MAKKPRVITSTPFAATLSGVIGGTKAVAESGGIENKSPLARYALRPCAYAYEVLKIKLLTSFQEEILESLHQDPYYTLVPSGNNQGKDFISGVAINYWMDCFDPGAVFLSGPSAEHTKGVLWAEVLRVRRSAGLSMEGFFPASPQWKIDESHFATALNVEKIESFQGRHLPRQLYIIDEATSISYGVLEAIDTMFDSSMGHAKLLIYNPTDITSPCYQEEQSSARADGTLYARLIRLSAMDHPNIKAQLEGKPKPIPNAVSLAQLEMWIDKCDEVAIEEYDPDKDVLWPPKEYATAQKPQKCYRHEHCPAFQSKGLGIWPSQSNSVFGKTALARALEDLPTYMLLCEVCGQTTPKPLIEERECCGHRMKTVKYRPNFPKDQLPKIGCDTATGCGGDWFFAAARWGDFAILAETSNTLDALHIVAKLKVMVDFCVNIFNRSQPAGKQWMDIRHIRINIDDDQTGRAICSFMRPDGYWLNPVSSAKTPTAPPGFMSNALPTKSEYPNIRSQLWFEGAQNAKEGHMILGGLPKAIRDQFRLQVASVSWKLNARAQNEVEPKQVTKDRIGRSPDTCFVAGTMILASTGQRPIETVKAGDLAWTRKGWRRVVRAGMTRREADVMTVHFSNGASLTGTRNHPIFVRGKGWTPMDAILLDDIVEGCENQSFSTASSLSATQTARAFPAKGTSTQTAENFARSTVRFIRRFGSITTDLFQKAWRFITRTKTGATTASTTWNASPQLNIESAMVGSPRLCLPYSIGYVLSRRSGTHLQRGAAGTQITEENVTNEECLESSFAKSAEKSSRLGTARKLDFVVASATRSATTKTRPTLSMPLVPTVESRSSNRLADLGCGAAPVRVVRVTDGRKESVFNLTVDDAHEYYANGILVHNCDGILLCWHEPIGLSSPKLPNLKAESMEMTTEERHDRDRAKFAASTLALYNRFRDGGRERGRFFGRR
jgi:hypothetical protein